MNEKLNVCLIYGGRSGEHEVSIRSAISIDSALDRNKYEISFIGITKTGKWIEGVKPIDFINFSTTDTQHKVPFKHFKKYDVIFPVLHGPFGEDGTIQGLFEMADVPYVGAGVLSSAIAMDKAIAKEIYARKGLPIVEFIVFTQKKWDENRNEIIETVKDKIGYACFTKPSSLGSSLGITKVHSEDQLETAVSAAAEFDRKIIVEKAIECREIECSILGNDSPIASIPGEIIPSNEFYDYHAKYIDDKSQLIVPAQLSDDQVAEFQRIAIEAFIAIDCSGMARADFFLEKQTGKIYVNELNTIPGFTQISMYPKLWEASGIPYPELLNRLISLALEKYNEKTRIAASQTKR